MMLETLSLISSLCLIKSSIDPLVVQRLQLSCQQQLIICVSDELEKYAPLFKKSNETNNVVGLEGIELSSSLRPGSKKSSIKYYSLYDMEPAILAKCISEKK